MHVNGNPSINFARKARKYKYLIDYVLGVCLDQVGFMADNLQKKGLFERISTELTFDAGTLKNGMRPQALKPIQFCMQCSHRWRAVNLKR